MIDVRRWVPIGTGLMLLAVTGCARRVARSDDSLPRLSLEEVTALLPAKLSDRSVWAVDIDGALRAHGLPVTLRSVCAVAAVVEQESGFHANPEVPGLTAMVRGKLRGYAGKLGPVGDRAMTQLLEQRAPGTSRTFDDRIAQLKTERDVDLLFQDLLAFVRGRHPRLFSLTNFVSQMIRDEALTELNPITTAGSMQVSVRFSEELAREKGLATERVREQLYTREGGLYYGVWRLLGHPLTEENMLHRFADYNAGVYASRNAALQSQLSHLVEQKLALDGDFLAYDRHAKPLGQRTRSWEAVVSFRNHFMAQLSDRQIERDLHQEKTQAFEGTPTYRAIRSVFLRVTGTPPTYARLPDVMLQSPKLTQSRSTAWFAQSVDKRYRQCVGRSSPQ